MVIVLTKQTLKAASHLAASNFYILLELKDRTWTTTFVIALKLGFKILFIQKFKSLKQSWDIYEASSESENPISLKLTQ